MKFFLKYKRLISVLLTVTVSVMLYVSVLPASAAVSNTNRVYGSLYVAAWQGSGHATYINSADTGVRFGDKYGYHLTNNIFLTYRFDNPFTVYSSESRNQSINFTWNIKSTLKLHTSNIRNGCFAIVYKNPDGTYHYGILLEKYCKSQLVSSNGNPEYSYYFSFPGEVFSSYCESQKIDNAQCVGIAYRCLLNVSDIWSYISVTECETFTGSGNSSLSGLSSILSNVFSPLLSFLANAINAALSVVGATIVTELSTLSSIFQTVGQIMEPAISAVLDNLILPVLNSVLSTLNKIVASAVEEFTPVIAGIINFFAPYFNKIQDIVTTNFLDLVSKLSPLVKEFVTAIAPSFDSVVTNISKNISLIIEECFVPSDSSKEYQEFVSLRDDVTNKFPIFTQLKSFVMVLFDPVTYKSGSSVYFTNLICRFSDINSTNVIYGERFHYNFSASSSYMLTFNTALNTAHGSLAFFDSKNNNVGHYDLTNGSNCLNISLKVNAVSFYIFFNDASAPVSITDICLYSVDSSAGEDFTVNVYGKKVSVLDFNWYMPYKHYGDICVIAFCYLAFIWHTFKRLPSII